MKQIYNIKVTTPKEVITYSYNYETKEHLPQKVIKDVDVFEVSLELEPRIMWDGLTDLVQRQLDALQLPPLNGETNT